MILYVCVLSCPSMKAKGHALVGGWAGVAVSLVPFLEGVGAGTVEGVFRAAPWLADALTQVGLPSSGLPLMVVHGALGWLTGTCVGTLPDFLEPSKLLGPNHRQFLHSWSVFCGLGITGFLLYRGTIALCPSTLWMLVLPAIAAYMSHLFFDAFTTKGLPFI